MNKNLDVDIILKKRPQLIKPTIICGLPGSGYVGKLGVDYLVKELKAELFGEALKRGAMVYPVSTAAELLNSPQLTARGFWVALEHPELGTTITYPGPFAKCSETPPKVTRRAPLIGEHNQEIYEKELGISKGKIRTLKQDGII